MGTRKSKKALDDWVKQAAPPSRGRSCLTCAQEEVVDTLRELLRSMIRNNAHGLSRRQLYDKLCEMYKENGYDVSFSAFRDHLLNHESVLWAEAKGRKTGDA